MDLSNHDESINDPVPTHTSTPAILQSLSSDDAGSSDPQHLSGTPPTTSLEAYADTIRTISAESNKFFITCNIPDAEAYLSALNPQYHKVLVERLVLQCLERSDPHAQALADLFASFHDKQLCSPSAFRDGFMLPVAVLDIVEAKYPQAIRLFTITLRGAGLDDEHRTELASKYINPGVALPLFLAAVNVNKREKQKLAQAKQAQGSKAGKGKKGKGRKALSTGESPLRVEVNNEIVSPQATSPPPKITSDSPLLPVEARNHLSVVDIYGDGSRSMGPPTQLAMTMRDVSFLALRLGFTNTFADIMGYLTDATTRTDQEQVHPRWLSACWDTPHLSALRVVPLMDVPPHRLIPHKGVLSWPSPHEAGKDLIWILRGLLPSQQADLEDNPFLSFFVRLRDTILRQLPGGGANSTGCSDESAFVLHAFLDAIMTRSVSNKVPWHLRIDPRLRSTTGWVEMTPMIRGCRPKIRSHGYLYQGKPNILFDNHQFSHIPAVTYTVVNAPTPTNEVVALQVAQMIASAQENLGGGATTDQQTFNIAIENTKLSISSLFLPAPYIDTAKLASMTPLGPPVFFKKTKSWDLVQPAERVTAALALVALLRCLSHGHQISYRDPLK